MSADPSMEHLNPFTSKNEMPVRVRPTLARSLAAPPPRQTDVIDREERGHQPRFESREGD